MVFNPILSLPPLANLAKGRRPKKLIVFGGAQKEVEDPHFQAVVVKLSLFVWGYFFLLRSPAMEK